MHSQSVPPAIVPEIDSLDETGTTQLMKAAQDGTVEEVKALLKSGGKVEIKDKYGWNALLYAVSAPNLAIYPRTRLESATLKSLLSASANVNSSDSRGYTALMIAAFENRDEFVQLLLDHGANVNAMNLKGATALSYARAKGNKKIVELLQMAGAIGIDLQSKDLPESIAPIDVLPKMLNKAAAKPIYTDEARVRGIVGNVRFRVLVGKDGSITKAKLVRGLPYGLTQQAILALNNLKVGPGYDNGQPVEYWLPVQYGFAIY